MPKIYLSPSTQDWNMYVTGSGSEEYNMNLLADALVPYLLSNGIQYQRNRPEMTAGSSIREANQGEYDLYLALHSNAAPEGRYGEERGIIAFYYPGSVGGQRAAELIAQELRKTRISEFGITGCLFVLRILPIVPSFGTDMITKLTIDKDRCRIRTPRTTQIYFFHSRSGCQLTVFENITEFFTLRSGSGSDIRITFTMQFAIFE